MRRFSARVILALVSFSFSICLLSQRADASIVADSLAEFSGVQGQDNWYYQNWYQPLGYLNNMIYNSGTNRWEDSNGAIFENGSHPHSTDWRISQVWVSEVSGTIFINGSVSLPSPSADGVIFQILTNYNINNLIYTKSLAATEIDTFSISFDVSAGDTVLFSVIGDGGISFDNTIWHAQISTTAIPEPSSAALVVAGAAMGFSLCRRRGLKAI